MADARGPVGGAQSWGREGGGGRVLRAKGGAGVVGGRSMQQTRPLPTRSPRLFRGQVVPEQGVVDVPTPVEAQRGLQGQHGGQVAAGFGLKQRGWGGVVGCRGGQEAHAPSQNLAPKAPRALPRRAFRPPRSDEGGKGARAWTPCAPQPADAPPTTPRRQRPAPSPRPTTPNPAETRQPRNVGGVVFGVVQLHDFGADDRLQCAGNRGWVAGAGASGWRGARRGSWWARRRPVDQTPSCSGLHPVPHIPPPCRRRRARSAWRAVHPCAVHPKAHGPACSHKAGPAV